MIRAAPLLLGIWAGPALACSPIAAPARPLTSAQLDRLAVEELRQSDAVLDAVVTRYMRAGVLLRPLRVWKGPRRRSYLVNESGCGVSFPKPGTKVRVLLRAMQPPAGLPGRWPDWDAHDPSLGGMIDDHRRLDRAIDRRLGAPRPTDAVTIGMEPPPPPPPETVQRR